jgi:hypothetical protein
MRILLASVAAIALTMALAACAPSGATSVAEDGAIEGTWIGSNLGYEDGEYQEREIRLIIEQSTETTFSGVKSWRELGGKWSKPENFAGALLDSTAFHAADSDGYIIGTVVSSTSIQATYLEAGDDHGAFALELEKQTD